MIANPKVGDKVWVIRTASEKHKPKLKTIIEVEDFRGKPSAKMSGEHFWYEAVELFRSELNAFSQMMADKRCEIQGITDDYLDQFAYANEEFEELVYQYEIKLMGVEDVVWNEGDKCWYVDYETDSVESGLIRTIFPNGKCLLESHTDIYNLLSLYKTKEQAQLALDKYGF